MPALAAIAINDGATTPVAHTFAPVSTNGAKAEWADRSPASPAGFLGLSHEVRRPVSANAAQRVIIALNVPVMATVDGSPVVVRYSSAKLEMNFSNLSSEQERKDVLAYVKNFLANATVATSIQNLEPFY